MRTAYIAGAPRVIHDCSVTGGIEKAQCKCLADNALYVARLLTQACDPATLHCSNNRYEIRMT
jgi:hypothetical protein